MNVTQETLRLFWGRATRYPRFLVPLLIAVPLTVLLSDFLMPYIISEILQAISLGHYNVHALWSSFGGQIIIFTIAVITSRVLGWRIIIWLIWHLELLVIRDVSQETFTHLMNMSANFHSNRFGGSLVSQANKLTGAYGRFVDAIIFNLYPLITSLVATIVILAPRVPLYAVVLFILSIIFTFGTIIFSKDVRRTNTIESQSQSAQTGQLSDSLTNIMAVKSFAGVDFEKDLYWQASSIARSAGIDSMHAAIKRDFYASVITSAITISSLVIAVIGVGFFHTDLATTFLAVTYTNAVGSRLWDFQSVLRNFNRAFGESADMIKILAIKPEVKDIRSPEPSRIKKGAIEFNKVIFTHDGNAKDAALFRGLTLRIKAGEKVGLVGHSGSGKTTLTRLLLRFSDIDAGEITIDKQNIAAIKQDDLRQAISYVPQEPLLFHRTIKENIAYGKPGATDQEIKEAAQKAQAAAFIESLPQGYETMVGERGIKLSGGQRQRIAIARAILKEAPILVLDEATSALDSESERLIQAALGELMKNRTAIVIAHRLSTVQKLDRIIVLRDGKIVEQGSHQELLAQKGDYSRLWAHQSGGFIED